MTSLLRRNTTAMVPTTLALLTKARVDTGSITYGCNTLQSLCPWNVRFSKELPADSPFQPREALAGKNARTLAREILIMDVDAYRAALRGSPMKRAKLPPTKRNAAVVLGNVGTAADADVLTRALEDPEPLVREHAAWELARLRDTGEAPR